ncbi:MAG: ABC transporter substrate-binding protein/permease, partial [Candidatus Phytoplasma sp.]|nr:ABC transporter substrate-binding protein/permease [Phytoplasma sp.]
DVQNGKADFALAGLTPTTERLEQVDFSISYFTEENTQVALVRNTDLNKFKTVDDINQSNVKIGAQASSLQQKIALEQAPLAHTKFIAELPALLEDLKNGQIDVLFTEAAIANTHIAGNYGMLAISNAEIKSNYDGNAVAVQKGSELLPTINEVVEELKTSGQIDEWIEYYSSKEYVKLEESDMVPLLIKGLLMTLALSLVGVVIGFILALIPTFMRLSNQKTLSVIASVYVDIIRGTPMLVQAFLIYSLMPPKMIYIGKIDMTSLIPGILALVINCSAYISEIIRGGILSIDKGQTEAARSLGLSKTQTMRKVILPQAIKNILPSLGNEFVTIIKETSIFAFLGIAELMYQIGIIKSNSYNMTKAYLIAGLLYLILTIPLSKLMNYFERRLKHEN